MNLKPQEREVIRLMFGGYCAYCGGGPDHIPLPVKGWHADHVQAIYRGWPICPDTNGLLPHRGVDEIDNIFPSCAACNIFKGVYDLEIWRMEIAKQIERARKKSVNFRFAEAFGLVQETHKPVIFFFEKWRDEQ